MKVKLLLVALMPFLVASCNDSKTSPAAKEIPLHPISLDIQTPALTPTPSSQSTAGGFPDVTYSDHIAGGPG